MASLTPRTFLIESKNHFFLCFKNCTFWSKSCTMYILVDKLDCTTSTAQTSTTRDNHHRRKIHKYHVSLCVFQQWCCQNEQNSRIGLLQRAHLQVSFRWHWCVLMGCTDALMHWCAAPIASSWFAVACAKLCEIYLSVTTKLMYCTSFKLQPNWCALNWYAHYTPIASSLFAGHFIFWRGRTVATLYITVCTVPTSWNIIQCISDALHWCIAL